MHTLVFDHHDIRLEYENSCLVVRAKDTSPRTLPLKHIRKIVCLHSVQVTTSLLGNLWTRGIDFIVQNNRYSERSFAIFPDQQKQVNRRCLQYEWQLDEEVCLLFAASFCTHRIKNNLRAFGEEVSPKLQATLEKNQQLIWNSSGLDQLRGLEGAIQKQVFEHWRNILPAQLGFTTRKRRPAPDPVNALLSLTYTLVHEEAVRQCKAAGLDSQLGFYHRATFGRHSLACDIMEPVRPYCEKWVVQCFIEGILDKRHFGYDKASGGCFLGKSGREIYYTQIENHMPSWQRQLKASACWVSKTLDAHLQGKAYANSSLVPH